MKVKNNADNAIAIGGTVIPKGATEEVKDWDAHKDTFAVKAMVDAGALSPGSRESTEEASDLRVTTMQQLDRYKVEYRKNASTDSLVALLAETKKKLTENGGTA